MSIFRFGRIRVSDNQLNMQFSENVQSARAFWGLDENNRKINLRAITYLPSTISFHSILKTRLLRKADILTSSFKRKGFCCSYISESSTMLRKKKTNVFTFSDFFLLQLNVDHFCVFCFKLAWHKDEFYWHENMHVWNHFHPKVLPPEEN